MQLLNLTGAMAMCLTGQALAITRVTYTLELGGDNHRSSWKNHCNPLRFALGTIEDYRSVGPVVTWDVRILISGGGSVATAGFSLELRDADGNLVPGFGKATPDGSGGFTTAGFGSSINDGTPRGGCSGILDPDEAAAFAASFTIVNPPLVGRSIDDYRQGGPGMDAYQYPSTFDFPAGSTALSGTLVGMSLGYASFEPSGCPSACGTGPGFQTAGIGLESYFTYNCVVGLDAGPIAEGQLSLMGLAYGGYSLVLIPGPTSVLSSCLPTVVPADVTVGSTRRFVTGEPPPCATFVTGRYLVYANSCYDGSGNGCTAAQCQVLNQNVSCTLDSAIDCSKSPQLPGSGQPATFRNYSNYSRGLNCIAVDFFHDAECPALPVPDVSMFTFTVGNVVNPIIPAPAPSNITISHQSPTTDRVYLFWPGFPEPGSLPNHQWLKTIIRRESTGGIPGVFVDDVFYWGLAIGEDDTPSAANPSRAVVSATDELHSRLNATGLTRLSLCDVRDKWDYNKSSTIDATDQILSRIRANSLTALLRFYR